MTAIDLTNSNTATVDGRTYTYNSTTSRWEITTGNSAGLTTEQVQDVIAAQLATNGSHTGISFAYDDSGDGAIDATVGTLNQNTTGSAATLTTPRNIGGVAFNGSADINLPGVNAAGTQNTTGSAVTLTTPREINGVAFNGSADITVPAGGVTVYATMALLVAVTGMSAGNMAFVTANNNLYMYTGSGWFKVATVENNSPSAITGVASATTLASDGTATVITAVSTDPEGFPLTWSYAVTTGSLTNGGGATATVSQADNVFTITPTTTEAYAGTFSITFSATDGTNAVTAASAFTLAFAYDWTTAAQQQKLTGSTTTGDSYGYNVHIDGDTAIVGARFENTAQGAAYIYTRSGTTWSLQQKLIKSGTTAEYDRFGEDVYIDGDNIIVGARGVDSYKGAAYVFTRSGTTWTQQQELQASDAAANDSGAMAVAISGNYAVYGAPYDDDTATNTGSAHVWIRSGTTWTHQQKLTASDAAQNDKFGLESVDIDGDTIVVGAYNENGSAGSVYAFTRSGTTWSQQQKIVASDAGAHDWFGIDVDIEEDTVVVGAYGDDSGTTSNGEGAAYIFTRSGTTWSQQQKLQASNAGANDQFGGAVDIDGDTIVVGAIYEDTGFTNTGTAYVFTRSGTTWTQQQMLQASDAAQYDELGWSVAISGDTIAAGARFEDTADNNAGAAYIFTRSGTTWSQQAKLTASDGYDTDYFGIGLALDGNTVVVAASHEDTTTSYSGAAYVFTRSGTTWSQDKKLKASSPKQDGALGGYNGKGIALEDDTIVCGQPGGDSTNGGAADIFVGPS